jgi:hypothetical protein
MRNSGVVGCPRCTVFSVFYIIVMPKCSQSKVYPIQLEKTRYQSERGWVIVCGQASSERTHSEGFSEFWF